MPDNDLTSSKRYAIGIKYPMDIELSPLIPKDQVGKPIVSDNIYLDNLGVSYVDAGEFQIEVTDKRFNRNTTFPIRSDFGNSLGSRSNQTVDKVTLETGRRQVMSRGRVEDIEIHIINESNIDSRVAAVSQHATIIPK